MRENFVFYLEKLFNKYYKKIVYFLVLAVLSVIFYIILYFFRDDSYIGQVDNSFIVAMTYLGIGCLSAVNNLGVFDLIGYGFKNSFSYIVHNERKYTDAYEYKTMLASKRKEERFNRVLYSIIFLIYIIVFICFYVNFRSGNAQ